ncbi:MAG: four helix bundle protein [Terriglobia bacterium]|jgi:four helix bundle protein
MLERQAAKTFRDLLLRQRAHAFVLAVYKATARFPSREIYGLTSQMRRAAISIAANIAARRSRNQKQILRYAALRSE